MKEWTGNEKNLNCSYCCFEFDGIFHYLNSVYASENVHYFYSNIISSDVTSYVRFYYYTITKNELRNMQFSEDEIDNLQLCQGITAYDYDSIDYETYYYPIILCDEIVAMLILSIQNGNYAVQLERSMFADSLNKLEGNCETPFLLVVCDNGYFAIDKNNNIEPLMFFSQEDTSLPSFSFNQAIYDINYIVAISSKDALDERISDNKMARSINERYLSTPFVPNVVINGEGQCWAASCASIVGYFYGINNYSELIELRDGIIETTSSIYWFK